MEVMGFGSEKDYEEDAVVEEIKVLIERGWGLEKERTCPMSKKLGQTKKYFMKQH